MGQNGAMAPKWDIVAWDKGQKGQDIFFSINVNFNHCLSKNYEKKSYASLFTGFSTMHEIISGLAND